MTFAPSCAPTTRRCIEQPETRAGLLSPRRLYELAQVSSPRSSRYSNMLFYGAIIGTVIIIKSEAVCSRVSSLSLSPSNELVKPQIDSYISISRVARSCLTQSSILKPITSVCIYFFPLEKKNPPLGKEKKNYRLKNYG